MNKISEIKRIYKAYSFLDFFRALRDMLYTKIFYGKGIRKIKQPSNIINKQNIFFNTGFSSGVNLRIEVLTKDYFLGDIIGQSENPEIHFGSNVTLNNNVHIGCAYKIDIGNDVLVGSNVLIIDHNHGQYGKFDKDILISPKSRALTGKGILIEDDVWIAENVSILPGSKIGKGSIVGTMTLINGEYPPYSMIVGIPGKVIKKFNHNTSQWERV